MTTIATTKFISGFKSVNTKLMHMCMIIFVILLIAGFLLTLTPASVFISAQKNILDKYCSM